MSELTFHTEQRDFDAIINEWTDTVLKLNAEPGLSTAELIPISRLGPLGQRLIYEANNLGMKDGLKVGVGAKENERENKYGRMVIAHQDMT